MIFQTIKNLIWPDVSKLQDPNALQFANDLGQQLIKSQQGIYTDLRALEFAENVSAVPTASSAIRGKFVLVKGGAGVADILKICVKNAADAYVWKTVTIT